MNMPAPTKARRTGVDSADMLETLARWDASLLRCLPAEADGAKDATGRIDAVRRDKSIALNIAT